METKKLAAFVTVVRLGSITGAAEALSYTQSGITHMMNSLEKELGVTLLERGRNGVRLTQSGEALLPRITAVVESADALQQTLGQLAESAASTLRLGAYSSISQFWLPEILRSFKGEYPDANIMIQMVHITQLYHMVNKGELDCAFVSRRQELLGNLSWVPLRHDELMAVLPAGSFSGADRYPVTQFAGVEFLMPANGFDLDILPVFTRNAVEPNIHYSNLEDPAIISMVECRLGQSIMADLVLWDNQSRIQSLPLDPPSYRELGMIVRKERRKEPLVHRFIRHAQDTVAAIYREKAQ